MAVGGGAGARRGGARTEPQMSVPWEEWLLSPPDSFFFITLFRAGILQSVCCEELGVESQAFSYPGEPFLPLSDCTLKNYFPGTFFCWLRVHIRACR